MRGDFVEQRQRRDARHLGHQPRMREHKADKAAPSVRRSSVAPPAAPSAHARRQIGEMRADQRPTGGGVAAAVVAQDGAIALLGLERRAACASALSTSPSSAIPPRERGGVVARRRRSAPQGGSRIRARAAAIATPSSAASRSTASSQGRGAPALFEQPVASAQRPLELADPRAVRGIDRQHQPIEKPAPLARRPGEQQIHRRGKPDEPQMIAKAPATRRRRAVDAGCAVARLRRRSALQARAEMAPLAFLLDFDRNAKPPGPPCRAHSASSARRRPRPGENSDNASRRLVLPAPFSPNRTTSRPPIARSSAV